MRPIDLANRYLIDFKERNGEVIARQCPFCKPTKKDNLYKFYMGKETGAFKCYRENNCGRTGSFNELLKHFGETKELTPYQKNKYNKKYTTIRSQTKNIKNKVEKYLTGRDISKKTWESLNVKEEGNNLAFEYYEDGELVLLKYRNRKNGKDKKYWQKGGGKPILWNIDKIDTDKPLVICEGELDCLSIYESGFKNVTSVPFGTNNFKWIKHCWDKLNNTDEIIIWSDNDKAGLKMRDKAIKRLGKHRCKYVECEYKDANKLLSKEGKQAILDRIENAQKVPITQLKQLHEIEVFDPSGIPKVKSNIKLLNKYLGGYMEGMITIWTGANASGKSTFLNQQALETIDQNKSVCIVSAELPNSMLKYWVELQAAGHKHIKSRYDPVRDKPHYYVAKEIKEKIWEWCKNKLFIYDSMESLKAKKILEIFEDTRKRHNTKNFIVDNLMILNYEGKKNDKYDKQAQFVKDCKDFAKRYDSHVHIVAHPKKVYGLIKKQDIAGLYEISNAADNVCGVTRVNDCNKKDLPNELESAENILHVFKCRLYGSQDINIKLKFDEASKRMEQEKGNNDFDKQYGWNKEVKVYSGYDDNAGF